MDVLHESIKYLKDHTDEAKNREYILVNYDSERRENQWK